MITIKKAASLTGLSVKAIRHYESRGLLPKPERTDAGYRMYSESDIARLQQIRYFREMKFPLTEIAALLDASTEEVQKAMIRQQAEVDRILEEYKRAQMLLQSLLPEDIDAAALSSAPDVCRPAIVAIDLQNDILEGGALACGRIHLILPQLKKLFARARQMGVPVIYVCDRHYKNDPELQLWNNHMMAGSYGVQIIDEVKPDPADFVVYKKPVQRLRQHDARKKAPPDADQHCHHDGLALGRVRGADGDRGVLPRLPRRCCGRRRKLHHRGGAPAGNAASRDQLQL